MTLLADTYLERNYGQLATAAISLLLAFVAVRLVNRALARRGERLVKALHHSGLSQEADTRLRFTRRVIDVVIITIGVALALSQFTALDQIGRTVLTSSAIAAAVIGFAARQVLANALAGIMLAVTQPLRIGDRVVFEGEEGTVEEIKLTSTWLRTPGDARVVIPNERLAAGILRNETIISATVAVEAEIWLPAGDDVIGAVDALRAGLEDVTVSIAETSAEGTRIVLGGAVASPGERPGLAAELREKGLRTIRGT